MKTHVWWSAGLALTMVACLTKPAAATPPPERPSILAVETVGSNLLVRVNVPAGIHRITVAAQETLGQGAWIPRAVRHLDGQGGVYQVELPGGEPCLMLRVFTTDDEGLPSGFFAGPSSFDGEPVATPVYDSGANGRDVVAFGGDGPLPPVGPTAENREVIESDIWRLHVDTLYFFNQYRGLQLIDVADPETPLLLGTLPLPAAGEQMYVLNDQYAVLLVRKGCGYSYYGTGSDAGSACLVVDTSGATPTVVAELPVSGSILDSRLVGTALYVSSAGYLPTADSSTWEWQTTIASFDLANPAQPLSRPTLHYGGSDPVVAATDQWLFVALRSAGNVHLSTIHAINISAPNGFMWEGARLTVPGQVRDKFNLHLRGDVFTVIYESSIGQLITRLETYRFLGLWGFWRLGAVSMAPGERLFATRFDGDHAYLVTFEQIDPLWIVDLADPAHPTITGELEVPGFSTYIHPLGDRLVTVGREGSFVAVSLFGVANPADPVLLDRVLLGDEGGWSYSEATFDEKAFGVFPGEGLILVPFQYRGEQRMESAVQLVDLGEQTLTERGRIEHGFQPRRAAVHRDRILSVSARELVTVDAVDRDDPRVTALLQLSWAVDRVFSAGPYLLELSGAFSWYGESADVVARVVAAEDPGEVLSTVSLGPNRLVGATLGQGHLYVAQAQGEQSWILPEPDGEPPAPPTLTLSVYDLALLPALQPIGRVQAELEETIWGDLTPLWPRGEVLVWRVQGNYWPYPWLGALDVAIGWAPWYEYGQTRLIGFDVSDPTAPTFASEFVRDPADPFGSPGSAFAAAGLVFSSHATYVDPERSTRTYGLDVIDYEDPAHPTLRPTAGLPGTLNGVNRQGNLLYTVSYHAEPAEPGAWRPRLDALAYDGMAAHLIDSMPLPNQWPNPVSVVGETVLIGQSGTDGDASRLEAVTLSNQGTWVVAGSTAVPAPVQSVLSVEDLVLAQTYDQILVFAEDTLPAFDLLGADQPDGCIGYQLHHAHGTAGQSLWIPLGAYGVWELPLPAAP